MPPWLKFLTGLAVAFLIGWLFHGPLGYGEKLTSGLERKAQAVVAETNVPGVTARIEPGSRRVLLSGPADAFQREGQGELKGINDLVSEIEGVSAIQWADEGRHGDFVLPLIVEVLLLILLAYLAGFGLGWLVFGRRRDDHY